MTLHLRIGIIEPGFTVNGTAHSSIGRTLDSHSKKRGSTPLCATNKEKAIEYPKTKTVIAEPCENIL